MCQGFSTFKGLFIALYNRSSMIKNFVSDDIMEDENLRHLESFIKYKFKDIGLLKKALTHSSHFSEIQNLQPDCDNERLEFLGDAILDSIVSEMLIKKFPEVNEGTLTGMRASLVNAKSLANIGRNIQLNKYLRVGKSDFFGTMDNLISSAYEAVIGAVHTDGGYYAAYKTVSLTFDDLITHLDPSMGSIEGMNENYKGLLQNLLQNYSTILPIYKVLSEKGEQHTKIYEIKVEFSISEKRFVGKGTGASKKKAEQMAARDALKVAESWLQKVK